MKVFSFLTKKNISIGLIWLFHVSGIMGIIYSDSIWFLKATPINLILSFVLLLTNTHLNSKAILMLLFCFTTGMAAEIIGVEFGFLFGNYSYGDALGYKVMGVPLTIGINWCILIFITGFIAQFFSKLLLVKVFIGVGLMLFLDLVMEPVAPKLDFWTFEGGLASFQNYFGWTIVALPLQWVFHKTSIKIEGPFPFHLYLLQFMFFLILLLKLNTTEFYR
ncbi:MAG: carotenoid biosynthesis protein [Flavobacteriales bacterium]|jgi:putative membrane protein